MTTIPQIIGEELEALQQDIVAQHEQAGQVATGKTKASFQYYASDTNQGTFEGVIYANALERGRGSASGGGGNSKQDFIDNLKQWIVARGLDYGGDEKGLERLAKFLRWYINKNGTKLFRSGNTVDIFTTPITQFEQRIANKLSTFFETEIENQLVK